MNFNRLRQKVQEAEEQFDRPLKDFVSKVREAGFRGSACVTLKGYQYEKSLCYSPKGGLSILFYDGMGGSSERDVFFASADDRAAAVETLPDLFRAMEESIS